MFPHPSPAVLEAARRALAEAPAAPIEPPAPPPLPPLPEPIPAAERDPHAWAIYLRAGDVGDASRMMRSLRVLGLMVGRAEGHITGIYGDLGDQAGPEMGVLLGHATHNRFSNLAIMNAASIGSSLDRVASIVLALFDLGVSLFAYQHAGNRSDAGIPLDLDQVGREVLGAVAGDSYGRTIDVISNTVGTAPGLRRGQGTD